MSETRSRRPRSVAVSALVLLALLAVVLAAASGAATANADGPIDLDASDLDGNGTANDPYVITNASELQAMEDDLGAHYELGEDVDANGTAEWNDGKGFDPVGRGEKDYSGPTPFEGSFDGKGHEIRNLTVNRDTREEGEGLFGRTDGAKISNVSLIDVDIHGGQNTGGIVGYGINGAISEVSVSGDVIGGNAVGGIIGASNVPVSDSYATVDVEGDHNVGGIVGYMSPYGSVSNAYTIGRTNITGDYNDPDLGAVVGYNQDGAVENTYWAENDSGDATTGIGSGDGGDATGLTTDEMTGEDAETNMFAFGDAWVVTEGYPVLTWEASDGLTVDSLDAADVTVTESEAGELTVAATDEAGTHLEGVSIVVADDDGLSGVSTGDANVTDENGEATFSFVEDVPGDYEPEFVWEAETAVSASANVTVEDATDPVADAGDNQTVDEGETVTFDGSASSDNDAIAGYEWEFFDGRTATGGTPSHTFWYPGTFEVELTVTDGAGNEDTDSVTVTVEAEPADSPGDDDHEPERFTDPDEIRAAFDLPETTTVLSAERASPEVTDENTVVQFSDDASLTSIESTGSSTDDVGIVELNPREIHSDADDPGTLVNATDVRVPDELADANATVGYRLSADSLDDIGATPSDLSLYRHADGDWERLPTAVAEVTEETVELEGETAGFSVIGVIATSDPDAVLADLPKQVEMGDPFTLDASASTDEFGELAAYEWSVGDTSVTGQTADIAVEEAGTHEVTLTVTNDAGETATATTNVTVETEPTDSDTDPEESDADASEPSADESANESSVQTDDETPGFGVAVALVAAILSVGLAVRRVP